MNDVLVKIFREIAALLEIKGETFKTRAYERVAYALEGLGESVEEIYRRGGLTALEEIPGVGEGIGKKIEEFIKTGKVKEYAELKKDFPVDISGLMRIEGLGPKTIAKLYNALDVKNIAGLEAAIKHGRLAKLKGFGEKSQQKLLKGISFLEQAHGRFLLVSVLPLARKIVESIRQVSGVRRAEIAGSIQRMQETVGDLDILAISEDPQKVMDWFVGMPEVQEVLSKGATKTAVRLKIGMDPVRSLARAKGASPKDLGEATSNGMDADLRVVPPESFGAALQYFIGDKYHNVAVREMAIKKGYKLNEYGLFKGEKIMASEKEEEIYEALGMDWIPSELRTNRGEIEAAQEHRLPQLIDYGEVKGDLQVQTNWTDGENSIKEMALAAKKEGLEYICITDHTKSLGVAGGLNKEKIIQQMKEIDKVQEEVPGIKILKGAEANILKDGTLDINDETLSKLDVVGVSVHSHFNMEEVEMTQRIVRAMNNPHADIFFHPTGRIIQKREPYQVNMAKLIAMAKKTKTVLEANAYPERLDLKDEHIHKAVEAGVKIAIDSDAHSVNHFKYLEYGIAQARRGWATKKDVINAHGWREMLKLLK